MKKSSIAVVIALALIASGCGGNADSNDAENRKIRVMLDWTPNTNHNGIYLAKARNYYRDAGLDVEILQPGDQGPLPSLATGDVDFAVSVQESLIPARAEGAPLKSVGAILSTNTSSLLSLVGDGIKRPKDLEGKKYGGFGGALEKQLIETLVRCDGGDPAKVRFVDVGNVDYRAGLEQDRFDFAWVFNGWDVIRFRQQRVEVNTISFSDWFTCIPDWYTPLIATTDDKVEKDPQLVKKFMEATAKGYHDSIAEPSAASEALLSAAPELDAKLVRESSAYLTNYYKAPYRPWGTQDLQTWDRFTQFLQTAGGTAKPVPSSDVFTNDFLPAS